MIVLENQAAHRTHTSTFTNITPHHHHHPCKALKQVQLSVLSSNSNFESKLSSGPSPVLPPATLPLPSHPSASQPPPAPAYQPPPASTKVLPWRRIPISISSTTCLHIAAVSYPRATPTTRHPHRRSWLSRLPGRPSLDPEADCLPNWHRSPESFRTLVARL
ncbi:hypothetical protein EJ04DRAFT_307144 [Polyplosphaeria fusca]|uniref:Uncharacterized protein n=1 Tax=Polyplosphaeria fusca TaxID=682080 RepID=A0A9P4V0U6_9PLEO|nr:hypothetical protein EJ04DRAFT_307144 [Polyplosphaeria fusca]